jgi:hypothetical protein
MLRSPWPPFGHRRTASEHDRPIRRELRWAWHRRRVLRCYRPGGVPQASRPAASVLACTAIRAEPAAEKLGASGTLAPRGDAATRRTFSAAPGAPGSMRSADEPAVGGPLKPTGDVLVGHRFARRPAWSPIAASSFSSSARLASAIARCSPGASASPAHINCWSRLMRSARSSASR